MGRADGLDPERIEDKLTQAAKEMQVSGIDLGSSLGVDDTKLL
jgi:hypothetical protein